MNGTVKQFKEALEEMKTIYPYQDEKTVIQTRNAINMGHNHLSIATRDEKTGILVEMSKSIEVEKCEVRP
jgi:hypothetical protein